MSMRILYMTNIPSPYRVEFFNELGKYCDLTVLFERREAKGRDAAWLKGTFENFTGIFLKGVPIANESALCPVAIKYLHNGNFDGIIIGGYSTPTAILSIQYLAMHRMPFMLNSDGGMVKDDGKIKYAVKRYLISRASAWLSTGKTTDEYLIHYGAKQDRIRRYPFTSLRAADILAKPVDEGEKAILRLELGMTEKKIVLSVGQFIHRKGFDVLIKASDNLSDDVGVYIVGGEPTPEYLMMKDDLKLDRVHFIGFKQKDELKKYYAAADLFVLPTREDIWGLVVNEAMAAGLPIVATNRCNAGLELVSDGVNGYIIPIDDAAALAERINEVFANPIKQKAMAEASLRIISNYTIENMAAEHIVALRGLS